MTESYHRARAVLAEALGVAAEGIDRDASIDTVAAWNSHTHMRLILELERLLGHELPPEAVIEISSLEDVAALLEGAGERGTPGAR